MLDIRSKRCYLAVLQLEVGFYQNHQPNPQWRNIGTVTPALPGGAKLHEYLFSKMRLKDGVNDSRQTKNYKGYNKGRLNDGRRTKKISGAPKACQPMGDRAQSHPTLRNCWYTILVGVFGNSL